jgi:microcystin-dependent protein
MEPYIGEIRCFSFGKVPTGWLPCNGQTLVINQYAALYSLLSIQFGGDGRTNFNLPNLNGIAPIHFNPSKSLPVGGTGNGNTPSKAETVTLTTAQAPLHTHLVAASNSPATAVLPTGDYLAATASPHLAYGPASSPLVAMAADNVGSSGTGAAHSNMQPSLALNFCIATAGNYPPRP